ncbi:MAG: alpha-amylase family glycosyl hydrolase [Limnobacter sp.]|nr:alpha-amylase family glycosyl hydrolase [Limnobacter sp.]
MTTAQSPSATESFIRNRLINVYKDPARVEPCLTALLALVEKRVAERSTELKKLDAERVQNPNWHCSNRMMAYSAYVDRFAGNLKGVSRRIPHLKSMGVNYLHLLPFLKMRPGQSDGGFAVEDFLQVEPRLGTNQDLLDLTQELRANGISLCSDLVLNHVSDTHAWAQAARLGDREAQAMFYWVDEAQRQSLEAHLPQIFPQTAPGNFVWVEEVQKYVWSTFYNYQWDLNYSNPNVLVAMADTLLALANMGIEAFRLDSAAFLWKRDGTNCMNHAECHWILQCLRAVIDLAAPGVLLKAEAIVPTAELPPYFGQGDAQGRECHLAYQSSIMAASWYCLANQDASLLNKMIRELPSMAADTTWISYIRCHDDIGWNVLKPELNAQGYSKLQFASQFFSGNAPGSYADGISFQANDPNAVHGTNGMLSDLVGWKDEQDEHGFARYRLLMSLVFASAGIPMIYMGDELAQSNNKDYGTPEDCVDSRDIHRPAMDEDALNKAHSTPNPSETAERSVRAIHCIRSLRTIQKTHLTANNTSELQLLEPETAHPGVLAFKNGEVICLFNFSAEKADCRLSLGQQLYTDLLNPGQSVDCSDGLILEPWQTRWLKRTASQASNGL